MKRHADHGLAFLALAVSLAFSPSAHAAVPPIAVPDAGRIERLCPGTSADGLKLGVTRAQQDHAVLAALQSLGEGFAPFTDIEQDYTNWSGRLAALTYRAPSPDGDANRAWIEAMTAMLNASGWQASDRREIAAPAVFATRLFEKPVKVDGETRQFLLEIDAAGALMLRCGDIALLEIGRAEADGRLAPGTPRPVPPRESGTAPPLPDPAHCNDPALRNAFAARERINEYAPEMRALSEASHWISARENYGRRHNVWLKWKLVESGKATQDHLWEIEEALLPAGDAGAAVETDFTAFLTAAAAMVAAQKAGDSLAVCTSYVSVMQAEIAKDRREIIRWARLNEALEAEAKRLGIALDPGA